MNIDQIRASFPALGNNKNFIFADNAGGSQVLECVVKRISEYMTGSNVQMADYPYAKKAAMQVENGTAAAALFAGTKPENIMFGSSATQLFETLSRMMEEKVYEQSGSSSSNAWQPNDEIVVTSADHEANRGAWLRMASRRNLKVKTWNPTPISNAKSNTNVALSIDGLESLVNEKTKVVAFTASSNVLGSHFSDHDMQRVTRVVKEKSNGNAYVVVDAVAFAPHMRIRPEVWGVDFVVWSWYKVFGPHLGCMYLSPRSKRTDSGIIGKLNHHFLHGLDGMYPFQPSSVQYELVASVAGIIDYLLWVGGFHGKTEIPPINDYTSIDLTQASSCLDECYNSFSQQEQILAKTALQRLNSIKGLSILGDFQPDAKSRAPTIAFHIANHSSKQIHTNMVKEQVMGAQVGHMYAFALLETVGTPLDVSDGVARISFVHYNTIQEVEKVCDIIEKAAS